MSKWTQQEAIDLCTKIEAVCPQFGFHIALTGGLLYKPGERKDADFILYRIRQVNDPNFDALWHELSLIGIDRTKDCGFVTKATYDGKSIDFMYPEHEKESQYKDEEAPIA